MVVIIIALLCAAAAVASDGEKVANVMVFMCVVELVLVITDFVLDVIDDVLNVGGGGARFRGLPDSLAAEGIVITVPFNRGAVTLSQNGLSLN